VDIVSPVNAVIYDEGDKTHRESSLGGYGSLYLSADFFVHQLLLFKTSLFFVAQCWWLTPVILATWEAEIRRITV
jgi:hypothetical protein